METHLSLVSDSSMALQGTVPKAAQPQLAESGLKPGGLASDCSF